MPYELSWLVPDRVILIRYIGDIDAQELRAYLSESMQMRDEANARLGEGGPLVHTITDSTEQKSTNFKMSDVQHMLRTLRTQRVGWSIYVHPGALLRFLATLGHQWVGVRHREFATVPEAIRFLQEQDDTLPSIPLPDYLQR